MDPLTAIGIAGNIITFVDFSTKVVSRARELYESATGATAENEELEDLASNLKIIADKARYRPSQIPEKGLARLNVTSSQVLDKLSQQCTQVAQELLETLDSVKVQGAGGTRKSTIQALKLVRKQDHIDYIQRRLDRISNQLMDGISMENLEEINRRLRDMAVENKQLQANRSDEIDQLRRDFSSAIDQIKTNAEERQEPSAWLIISDAAHRGQAYYAEQLILQSLRFSALDSRHQSISKEHSQTFSWVFEETSSFNFVEWLRKEDGIFWISGKPGSGKSTLMKFISEHEQTKSNLEAWAGDKNLIIASFYFWSASTSRSQKSQRGLLRTILYLILRQCPELIQTAYQEEWIAMTSDGKILKEARDKLLTVPQLLNALRKVSTYMATETKFCFFLDRLDEYEGRPSDIIELVHILKCFHNVKACVASRPWNEFEDAFGAESLWKLYMQDHTRADIHLYVDETLGKNQRFQQLQRDDPACPDFVHSVVTAANGVFLWVFLVVQSLLDGLTNSDRIKDLQQRLDETPKDLNDYFQTMLFSTEDRYRNQTAQILTVAINAIKELPLMAYWMIDQQCSETVNLNTTTTPLHGLLRSRLDSMRRRLKALSKGLLEVIEFNTALQEDMDDLLFGSEVRFLHRTVRDYLQSPEARLTLQLWSDDSFNTDWEIFRSLGVLATMSSCQTCAPNQRMWDYCAAFFCYAKHLDDDPSFRADVASMLEQVQENLRPGLSENKEKIDEWHERNKEFLIFKQKEGLEPDLPMISACTCFGISNFVARKFAEQPGLCSRVAKHVPTLYWSALKNGFWSDFDEWSFLECSDSSMLQLLLVHGVNPNDDCPEGRTEWSRILEQFMVQRLGALYAIQRLGNVVYIPQRLLDTSHQLEIIKLLVKHGADLEQSCRTLSEDGPRKEKQETKARKLLREMFDADEYGAIEDIANRQRNKNIKSQQISKKMRRMKLWIKLMK